MDRLKIKGIKKTITSFLTEEEAHISDEIIKYGVLIVGLSMSFTPVEAYRCDHSLQHSNHCSQHSNCQHTSSHSNGGSHCNQHAAHSNHSNGGSHTAHSLGAPGHTAHDNSSHGNHSSNHCSVW